MGIPENHAKHSLYRTGNSSADMAVAWYFENMGDESLNLPLRIQKKKASNKNDVPQELLD
jgi:ubiquitin carboxyl-terminal hydrolase 5/13